MSWGQLLWEPVLVEQLSLEWALEVFVWQINVFNLMMLNLHLHVQHITYVCMKVKGP